MNGEKQKAASGLQKIVIGKHQFADGFTWVLKEKKKLFPFFLEAI